MKNTKIFGVTDIGKIRENNEDVFYTDSVNDVYIIADGMGGHNAGEVASAKSIEFIKESLNGFALKEIKDNPEEAEKILNRVLSETNLRILALADNNPDYKGMGCTIVMAIILNNNIYKIHVGDSRCYICRNDDIIQLGDDHSYVAAAVKMGYLTKEEARKSPDKNKITMAMGTAKGIEPDYRKCELQYNDTILLCSDGLWDMISDNDILKIINSGKSAEDISNDLISEANNAGGPDNISVIVYKNV